MSDQESLSDQVRRKHNLSLYIAEDAIHMLMDEFERSLLIKSVATKIRPYVIFSTRGVLNDIISMGNLKVDRRLDDTFVDSTCEPIPCKMDAYIPNSIENKVAATL